MDLVLFGDPLDVIMNYLDPLSMNNLLMVCNSMTQKSKLTIKNKVIEYAIDKMIIHLKEIFGEKYDEFCTMMATNKSIISGSIILQKILDSEWNGSDIDIYVPLICNKIFYTQNDNVKTEIDNFMMKHFNFMSYEASDRYGNAIGPSIKWVRTYTNKNNKNSNDAKTNHIVQVILVGVENDIDKMCKYINNSFDFDVCKNIYYYDDNKKAHLTINSIGNILNKTLYFKTATRLGDSVKRAIKYENRGFTIIKNNFTYDDYINLINIEDDSHHIISLVDTKRKSGDHKVYNIKSPHKFRCSIVKFIDENKTEIIFQGKQNIKCVENCPIKFLTNKEHLHYVKITGSPCGYYDFIIE